MCDVNALWALRGKIKWSKKALVVHFCATSTHFLHFLSFANLPDVAKLQNLSREMPFFASRRLSLLVAFCCFFAFPPGARHQAPGAHFHLDDGPFLALSRGSGTSIFARRQRVFCTLFRKWPANFSYAFLLPFLCRGPFLRDVNAFSPNRARNSHCERGL